MGRTLGRLTALRVEKEKRPGIYADGAGLCLRVTDAGTKNWVFRYMLNGKARWMGLGPLHTISLAEARMRAAECRKLRLDGIDPIDKRRAAKQQAMLESGRAITFRQCAENYIASHSAGWRNAKHAAQWSSTIQTYANPVIGALSVQSVGTPEVMRILEPIWASKTETASRLRGRIEVVLDWAKVRGYRDGDNPARWRGHLDVLLPARTKVRRVKHHAALPYDAIGEFVARLRREEGTAARALEFAILTAARTGEVLGVSWNEIDLNARLWTVPAQRMKGGREHRVPLSDRAVDILEDMVPASAPTPPSSGFVFGGAKAGRPLSNMAFLMLLRRMECTDATGHGFRSTFKDWTAERTNYPGEVSEMALAHTVSDKVEAAYRRGDLFDKRRRLMDDWAKHANVPSSSATSNVRTLHVRG
jgi:integrase